MHCSVREAQERIDSREFSEWIAYYQLEPFGEQRADIRAAQICSTVANCLVERRDGRKFTIDDFLLHFDKSAVSKQKTPQQMLETVKHIHAVMTAVNEARANKNG